MDQITAMRVFARVVEAGTFTKAADSLQMAAPTVTKLVQQLESHLRVKLLQRTTRRVTVTPEGAAYYERTSRVLAELGEIEDDLTHAQSHPRGRLRVDVGSSVANLILLPALPSFRQRHPDIRLEFGVSDRPVDLLGDAVDCVIRGGTMADPSLVARRVAWLPFLTCAAPSYLQRHGTPTQPTDLALGHLVVDYLSSATGRPVAALFERDGERIDVATRSAVAVSESTAHVTAAVLGLGVVQTLAFMARPHLASGALVEILAPWQPPPLPLHVAYPPNRNLSAKLRAFVDWTVEVFAGLDD